MSLPRLRWRSLTAAVELAAGALGVQFLLAVSGILSARMLGVEGRGQVALIMAISGMASVLTFGSSLPVAVATELARRGVTARDGLRRLFPRWSLLACIPALLAAGYILVVLDASNDRQLILLTGLTAVAALQAMASRILVGAMQGELASVRRMVGIILLAPTLSTGLLTVAFVSGWDWDVVDLLTAQAAMWTIGLLIPVALLRRPRHDRADELDGKEIWRLARANYVSTMAPSDGLGLDRTLTGTFIGDAALGLYAAGTAIANLPGLIGSAVGAILLPRVAAQPSVAVRRRLISRWLAVGVFLTTSFAFLLVVTAEPVIRFAFGEEFVPAVDVTRWLIVAQGVLGIRRLLIAALQGCGRGGTTSVIELGLTALVIGGIVLAVVRDNLIGVAIALVVVGVLSCAVYGGLLLRSLRLTPALGPGSRVLMVELGGQGHRFYYVRLLVEEALSRGARVALVTRLDPITRDHLEVHLGDVLDRVEVMELPTPGWSDVESVARDWQPNLTVVPEADHYVLRLLARGGWRAPGTLSLVIMRARVPSVGTPLRSSVANVVKAIGVTSLLLMPGIRLRVLRGQTWSSGGWWPSVNDPATLQVTADDVAELRSRWGLEPDRFWVGVLGAVTENKNLPLVVEAVSDVAGDHSIGLLVAGRIAPSIQPAMPELEQQLAAAGAAFVVQDRLLTDIELDASVAAIDCMALAYSHNGPSGTFGKALLAGTRVISAGSPALRRDSRAAPDLSVWVPLTAAAVADGIRGAIAAPPAAPMVLPDGHAFAVAVLGADETGRPATSGDMGLTESLVAEEKAIHLQDPTI